jgi:hypothetical protein
MKQQKQTIFIKKNNLNMKLHFKEILIIFLALFSVTCKHKYATSKEIPAFHNDEVKSHTERNDSITIKYTEDNEIENGHDEYISTSLFEKWVGIYILKDEDQIDALGRESTSFSELILIKPDSCIFKCWLADKEGRKYCNNDNYQEYIGGILATSNRDSIEFYTKRVVKGGNNSLSPLLTLTRNNCNYLIYSYITSPPNNGIIAISIKKLK